MPPRGASLGGHTVGSKEYDEKAKQGRKPKKIRVKPKPKPTVSAPPTFRDTPDSYVSPSERKDIEREHRKREAKKPRVTSGRGQRPVRAFPKTSRRDPDIGRGFLDAFLGFSAAVDPIYQGAVLAENIPGAPNLSRYTPRGALAGRGGRRIAREEIMPWTLGPNLSERGYQGGLTGEGAELAFLTLGTAVSPLRAGRAGTMGIVAFRQGGKKAAGEAAKQALADEGRGLINKGARRASSTIARFTGDALEKAGAPKGLADFVRNSPEVKRWFANGDSMIWVDPAKSRTGKLAEKAYDVARPALSVGPTIKGRRIALAKTEREKWAQALEQQHHEAWKQAQSALVQLDHALPHAGIHRFFKKLRVPEFYALRMVGKGVDPDTMVTRFKGLANEARKRGDEVTAKRLDYHAGMAEAARDLVHVRPDGSLGFSAQASRKLLTIYEHIERAGKFREDIYANLDLLTESNAKARITNEELWHYGATYQQSEEYFQKVIEASPNRQALLAIAEKSNPEEAEATMNVIDSFAREFVDRETASRRQALDRLRADIAAGDRDPQKAVMVATLERNLARGVDPDIFYRQWKETYDEFPPDIRERFGENVLLEIKPFHNFVETKTRKNLASKLNPKANQYPPKNRRVWRNYNGQKIVVLGDVTPEQWVKRVLAVMPDEAERAEWSKWYDEFEPMFRAIFGEDADKLMRGFAVSQANASPASGLRAVFKIVEALSRGEKVEKGYGSVVAASIAKAVEGGEIDKGIAAKLSDFIDSLAMSDTRTWMGNDVRGGRPVAVDVWAARDRGYVDKKMLGRLNEKYGISDVVTDSPGSPTGPQYERTAEWYERLTQHLNDTAFDGRTDWQPRQVQALGWASIQKVQGLEPQDFAVALGANTRRVGFEVTQGMHGLGDDLTNAQAEAVARELEPEMRRIVESTGAYLNGIEYDVSTWAGRQNASVGMKVIGTDEQIDRILTLTAQAFDQSLVQGTRRMTGKGSKASLTISSEAFSDKALRNQFRQRLNEVVPKLAAHGDMPDKFHNLPGLTIITSRGSIGPKAVDKWLDGFEAGIRQVEEEMGIEVHFGARNYETRIGDQVGRTSFDAGAGRTRELDDLDPVAREVRDALDAAIGRVREAVPADPEEVAARALAQDRAAYDSLLEEVARSKGAKKVTEKQLADAEAESVKLADRFPDEQWSQEFHRLRSSLGLDEAPEQDVPGWLLSALGRGGSADLAARTAPVPSDAAKAGRGTGGAAEAARGGRLVERRPGYADAVAKIQRGELPVDWLKKLVADADDFTPYERWRIGAHLSDVNVKAGGNSIIGMDFPSVPGFGPKFLAETVLRGLYDTGAQRMVIGPYGAVPTVLHELTHMMQASGVLPRKFIDDVEKFLDVKNGEWSEKQLEEMAHIMEAVFLGFKAETSHLPKGLQDDLLKVRATFVNEIGDGGSKTAVDMLMRLEGDPAGARLVDAAQHLMDFRPKTGYGFHGASKDFRNRAKVYMPETLGLPASYGKDLFALRSYAARLGGLVGNKSNILPGDKALSHTFTAHLLESGAFDRNVVKGTLMAQMKAARIHAMSVIRDEARKIGTPIPQRADDIAIPLNATRFAGDQGKNIDFVAGMLHSIEDGKLIGKAEIDKVDLQAIEDARDILFPGISKATEADTQRLAEEIMAGVKEPIEGVVWVNRQDLVNTAAFNVRSRNELLRVADSVNDYLKGLLLVMKPSYIPMNFIGNTAMGFMQQGAWAPINYAKAWHLNRALGDDAVLIDFFTGSGFMKSILPSKSGIPVLSQTLDAAAEVSNFIVDRHWRRAAFLYEARKMGYRDAESLRALLKDPANVDDLTTISKRAKNAMVDFENLSTFEKDIMSRAIFVYPWFKGATYWAGRFVKDHPIQATIYAYLISQQQDRLNDAMPDGYPGYLKWFLPLGTSERDGKEMPYGLRLDQALTFLTPLDLAHDIMQYTTGQSIYGNGDPEAFASMLNPLYDEFLKTITGYDSFTGQEVSKNWLDFFARLTPTERSVAWQQLEMIFDEDRRERSMYHPTQKEAWLKLFFGSLTPGVIDPEKAAERSHGHNPDAAERIDEWRMRAERIVGEPMPPEVIQWKQNEQAFNKNVSELERDTGTTLTTQERFYAALQTYAELNGKKVSEDALEAIRDMPEEEAEEQYASLRRELGLTQIDSLGSKLSEAEREKRVNE